MEEGRGNPYAITPYIFVGPAGIMNARSGYGHIPGKEDTEMSRMAIILCVCFVVASIGGTTLAAEKGVVEVIADGCSKEIGTYCKDVTPGEARVLACLYAYGDKLSSRCEYALYDAAAQLERVIVALVYLSNECRADLKAFCSDVK